MEFTKTNQLAGDTHRYSISPEIKEYTLIDLEFEKTTRGNYRYSGSLDRHNPFKPYARLKITVAGDLSGFKMDTVNSNGFAKINIFKGPRKDELTTQLRFILDEMVQRGIFTED